MSKKKKIIIGGVLLSLIAVVIVMTTSTKKTDKFPEIDLQIAKKGDLINEQGTSENKYYKEYPKEIKTTFTTIVVPENRNDQNSRLISLPVKILHSLSENPKEPVFRLTGGPGSSNIKRAPDLWLLEDHDIVMVGYRGIDGSVILKTPEIPKSLVGEGDPLSLENLKNIAERSTEGFNRLKASGIDVDSYTTIDVVDDLEDARKEVLGYEKINTISYSYGTRLAYYYGLRYPENVNRSVLEGVNPPGHFVWKSQDNEDILSKIAAEWQKDPLCLERSPDILATIRNVQNTFPYTWRGIEIIESKVKLMMFMMSYNQNGIVQVLDAFIAAENGDYSGLAFLNMAYDQLPDMHGMVWGENVSKALSADFDPDHDYLSDDPEDALMGAEFSKIFAMKTYGGWPIKLIPEEYRKLQYSEVETLLISGDIDVSTPCQNATNMLKYLPNGEQVIFENRGHQDAGNFQPKEYRKLIMDFYSTGVVDGSQIKNVPIKFHDAKPSFQKMGKMFRFIKRLGLTNFVSKFMN